MTIDTWKLQDAKARFSEVVRRARSGEPQHVTVHGEEAVVVVDPKRFDIVPKGEPSMQGAAPPLRPEPAPAIENVVAPPAPSPSSAPQASPAPSPVSPPPISPLAPPPPSFSAPPEPPAPAPVAPPPPPARPVSTAPDPVEERAFDLIQELELELRRLKEPLLPPAPPRRRD